MKHGWELVIIGLAAMQGCFYLKSQVLESHKEIHNYGKHPTPQNNYCTYSLKKQHKIVSYAYTSLVCKIIKFSCWNPNLSLAKRAKFHYFPILYHVSP